MAKVFISYAHQDQNFVAQIAKELEQFGHEVFFAGAAIAAGEKFLDTISKELRNADIIIFIISQYSIDSRWVMTEVGRALGYWEEKGKPLIIPVVIDNVSIPAQFLSIQSIIRNRSEIEDIIIDAATAIDKWIGLTQAKNDEKIEIQDRVEKNAELYINDSLERLRTQEKRYCHTAYLWYSIAFFALIGATGYTIYKAFTSHPDANFMVLIHTLVLSILALGMIIALSRFAFMLGKSFMVESLRNSDRIHAISFGKFYLNAYGEQADRQEIKEAFQQWNIDKGSDFIKQSSKDFDPEVLKIIGELATKLRPK